MGNVKIRIVVVTCAHVSFQAKANVANFFDKIKTVTIRRRNRGENFDETDGPATIQNHAEYQSVASNILDKFSSNPDEVSCYAYRRVRGPVSGGFEVGFWL